jgi:hypothetical protein
MKVINKDPRPAMKVINGREGDQQGSNLSQILKSI